jgi:alpha-tubulin suppressor-like RCC1 family protein
VTSGYYHSCAVGTNALVYCWGANFKGQLGDGTKTTRLRPTAVAGTRRFKMVRAGGDHTCALNFSNVVFCWGENEGGAVGDGTTTDRLTPTRVTGGRLFTQVTSGYYHSCAVGTNALVYCWGANFKGQLGDGSTTDRLTPKEIRGGRSFYQVRAGATTTCGVTTSDTAYCWGADRYGQVGDGRSGYAARRVTPTAVLGGLLFSSVVPGGVHTCGVTTQHRAYCWGDNAFGELGDGTTTTRLTPVAVVGGLNFKYGGVSTGYFHTCGVTTGGQAYCWGANDGGELGDGTKTNRSRPVAVVGP